MDTKVLGAWDVLGEKKPAHSGLSRLFQSKCPIILGHNREICFYKTEETLLKFPMNN